MDKGRFAEELSETLMKRARKMYSLSPLSLYEKKKRYEEEGEEKVKKEDERKL